MKGPDWVGSSTRVRKVEGSKTRPARQSRVQNRLRTLAAYHYRGNGTRIGLTGSPACFNATCAASNTVALIRMIFRGFSARHRSTSRGTNSRRGAPSTGSLRVRFEVTAPFRWANHCHCSRCRKHSGGFGGTQGRVPREGFQLLAGEELIRVFKPDDGRVKAFCSVCGSSLFGAEWPEGEEVAIRLGSPDADPGIRRSSALSSRRGRPGMTIPDDGLPRYDEGHP
jgi:hypothetical protein